MSFVNLARAIIGDPLLEDLEFSQVELFFGLTRHLRLTISYNQPSYAQGPPSTLPANVQNFLVLCTGASDEAIKHLWDACRSLVWNSQRITRERDEDRDSILRQASVYLPLFHKYGLPLELAFYTVYPPTRVCLTCTKWNRTDQTDARPRELEGHLHHKVTIFSPDLGPLPGFAVSSYCRYCNTRYYADYYVHDNATLRTYYQVPLEYIQTSKHYFIAARLAELCASMMLNGCTSATNCARIYNEGLVPPAARETLPPHWETRLTLTVDDVWNGFFLHCLLLDLQERREDGEADAVLELQHDAPSQAERLRPALQARNKRLEGPGQEHWNHACDLCCWVFTDDAGVQRQLRSVVVDGVTLGHPCCAVHDCTEPLPTLRDRFCHTHRNNRQICSVVGCEQRTEAGFKTCALAAHRALESWLQHEMKAMFQLKRRLEKAGGSAAGANALEAMQPLADESGEIDIDQTDEVEVDEGGVCNGKPATGNRLLRALFGRRRTHNEELCVASCGVILGRATFFGSEAPNGVRIFLMSLFPTEESLPGIIWHDNNCKIVAMLENDDDSYLRDYFKHCALPVDVFHFKSKHKESDGNCNRNCNPANWPQLMTADGKWRFNSSAAEQANAWFGGYQAMVREMQVDRYNFFLDEMIKRRNRQTVEKLRTGLHAPYLIPRDELL